MRTRERRNPKPPDSDCCGPTQAKSRQVPSRSFIMKMLVVPRRAGTALVLARIYSPFFRLETCFFSYDVFFTSWRNFVFLYARF